MFDSAKLILLSLIRTGKWCLILKAYTEIYLWIEGSPDTRALIERMSSIPFLGLPNSQVYRYLPGEYTRLYTKVKSAS